MTNTSIKIEKCEPGLKIKQVTNPKFGTVFAPYVLRLEIDGNNFENLTAHIVPYQKEPFSPSTVAFHYGQSIFEGMKAFRQSDGSVGVFRAGLHAKRFQNSCKIMSMPEMPVSIFLECIKTYIEFVKDVVPDLPEHSLYLRPLMFGVDEIIKMGRSQKYIFYILASIAGNYFQGKSIHAAKVFVSRHYVRAYPGGLGEAKTAANYAASLQPLNYAATLGCDQILYLDAVDHDYIDELGGMNFFMVRSGELVTPTLVGTILDGVTRRSILQMAPSLGLKAYEKRISFTELLSELKSGKVTECFACGTAAVVQPIGSLVVQSKPGDPIVNVELPGEFPIAVRIAEQLQAIQRGKITAPGEWLLKV